MATSSTILHVTASTHFTIKLTSTNFPSWRKQVLSTLIGLQLDHHLHDNPPAKTITSGTTTTPNPDYNMWFRQDQMILSALLGSCSDSIQPLLSSADTSKQAWMSLNSSYANLSRSRILSLKARLGKNPKGSRSVTDFMHDMKSIADDLALAQAPVEEEDLVVNILNQLGDDYGHLVVAIKARETPISFTELLDKLLDHERNLKDAAPDPVVTTVNQTQRQSTRPYNRYASDNRSARTAQSNGRSSWNNQSNNRPQWTSQNSSRSARQQLFCYFCNFAGHDTKDCRKLQRFLKDYNVPHASMPHAPPVVNHTSPQNGPQSWMWDTGASAHTAPNHTSMPAFSDYGGLDEIVLGNGSAHGGATNAGQEH